MTKLENAITNVGIHSGDIMRQKAPYSIRYGVIFGNNVKMIHVEVKSQADPQWDHVWVDGELCGNRCEGVKRFSELASAFILECVLKALTEESA